MQAIQDESDAVELYRKIKIGLGEYAPLISLDKLRRINEIMEEKNH